MHRRTTTRTRTMGLVLASAVALAPLLAAPIALAAPPPPEPAPPALRAAAKHVTGDFDGDGRVDLAVGAPGANRVRVTYTHAHPRGSHVQQLHPSVTSFHYSMRFGEVLATGDFNGDGRSDLAVSAPSYTTPPEDTGVLETRGAIFVFLGSAKGLQARPLKMVGPYDGDEPYALGTDLAAADVNGDGRTDLAAVMEGEDYQGGIRLYSGTATGLPAAFKPLDGAWAEQLAFGDVNGDHHPDLIAAWTTDIYNPIDYGYGALWIFRGSAAGIARTSTQTIRGDQVGLFSDLGTAVASGDVNGDGYADVVAGAAYDRSEVPSHPSAGSIVVLRGSHSGLHASQHQTINEHAVYAGSHDGNGFGSTLSVSKVLGKDRYADVVVGAPDERVNTTSEAGAVYVLRGAKTGLSASKPVRVTANSKGVPGSASTGAHFGLSLFVTKVNADSRPDLVVGAPGQNYGSTGSGMYVTLRGTRTGITTTQATAVGSSVSHSQLGSSIR